MVHQYIRAVVLVIFKIACLLIKHLLKWSSDIPSLYLQTCYRMVLIFANQITAFSIDDLHSDCSNKVYHIKNLYVYNHIAMYMLSQHFHSTLDQRCSAQYRSDVAQL